MAQLADKFRVTPTNPKPPLVHFAFPVEIDALYTYAEKHKLTEYLAQFPNIVSPVLLLVATEHLSEEVEYDLDFGWSFKITADCSIILTLYTNYTVEEKMLIDKDQEDVIQMVQEALGMDTSVQLDSIHRRLRDGNNMRIIHLPTQGSAISLSTAQRRQD